MSHESVLGEEWFASLEEFDRRISEAVAAGGCRHCGGPLVAEAAEVAVAAGIGGLVAGVIGAVDFDDELGGGRREVGDVVAARGTPCDFVHGSLTGSPHRRLLVAGTRPRPCRR